MFFLDRKIWVQSLLPKMLSLYRKLSLQTILGDETEYFNKSDLFVQMGLGTYQSFTCSSLDIKGHTPYCFHHFVFLRCLPNQWLMAMKAFYVLYLTGLVDLQGMGYYPYQSVCPKGKGSDVFVPISLTDSFLVQYSIYTCKVQER